MSLSGPGNGQTGMMLISTTASFPFMSWGRGARPQAGAGGEGWRTKKLGTQRSVTEVKIGSPGVLSLEEPRGPEAAGGPRMDWAGCGAPVTAHQAGAKGRGAGLILLSE